MDSENLPCAGAVPNRVLQPAIVRRDLKREMLYLFHDTTMQRFASILEFRVFLGPCTQKILVFLGMLHGPTVILLNPGAMHRRAMISSPVSGRWPE